MANKSYKRKTSTNTRKKSNHTAHTMKMPNFKIRKENLILLGILLILFIVGYFFLGTTLSLIFTLGVGIILFFARYLDKTKSKKKQRRIINIVMIILLIFIIIGMILMIAFFGYVVMKAPKFDVKLLNLKESSIIYDNKNEEVRKLGSELRENIQYSDLPEILVDALVATEDSRFFQHNGFDAPRFLKATLGQLAGNSKAGGGSTLSMQVIKNSFTSSKDDGIEGIIRKFTDIYLAVFKLEKNYTKEEIIEFYFNNHELGYNSFGIEQASQTYFGKSCGELNLSEAALLVGMYNAPSAYNPYNYPDAAADRRSTVLSLMKMHGYITEEERKIADSIPVSSLLAPKSTKDLAYQSYYDTVIAELKAKGINYTQTPILIYTNMDTEKQGKVDDIYNGVTYTKWLNDVVQSAAAVVEVNTGKIVAIAGGRNKTTELSLNLAADIDKFKRQIGSTAKPLFDYAPGMEYLGWSTYTQFMDEPWTYSNGVSINNSDRKFMGQISLRTSLAQSRNIPALKAFQTVSQQVGNEKIVSFIKSLGITPEVENGKIHEAHSLGSFDGSNALQMAAAYAAFANGGYYIEPYTVNKIVYRDTGEEVTFEPEKTKVMSDSTAYMITYSLQTSVQSGLASGARVNGINLAAKTGTTSFTDETKSKYHMASDAINDAWIVGYDPEYSIGMWYGYEKLDPNGVYYNHSTPAVIQRGNIFKALENAIMKKNNQNFTVPSSVVKVGIEVGSLGDNNNGLLPSENTPEDQITYEYYKKGTEPTEVSTKYQKLENVTNLNVTYSEANVKTNITWSKLNTPVADASYGNFGYKVYLNDQLLGFTTENSYSIDRPTTISGIYKVVTCFENYQDNASSGTTFKFTYSPTSEDPDKDPDNDGSSGNTSSGDNSSSTEEDKNTYTTKLNGTTTTVKLNGTYTDPTTPLEFLENGTPITNKINLRIIIESTITGPDGSKVGTFSSGKVATFKAEKTGKYTITYKFKYTGKTYTVTRTITCS